MATKVSSSASPSNEYVVIDNGAPGASTSGPFPGAQTTPSNWIGAQYDKSCQGFDTSTGGTTTQGTNPSTNGTIPDYIATGATTVLNSPLSTRLLFKNPA